MAVSRFIHHCPLFFNGLSEVGVLDRRFGDNLDRIFQQIFKFPNEVEISLCKTVIVFTKIDDEVNVAGLGIERTGCS